MKKHFLLLVMAFMSIMAWAQAPTVTGVPTPLDNAFDGTEQDLLTAAATVSAGEAYYFVSDAADVEFDASTWSTTIPTAKDAGTYKVWYVAYDPENPEDGNSEPTSVNAVIGKLATTVTVETDPQDYTGATLGNAAFYAATVEIAENPVCTVMGAGATAIAVGTYAFTLSSNPNYEITFTGGISSGTLTIQKINLSVAADPITIEYGETPVYTYTWTGLVAADEGEGGQPLPSAVTISAPTVKNGEIVYAGNVGTYSITPNVTASNYNILSTNGTLTVTGKSLASDDIVLATPAGGTYTGLVQTFTPNVTDKGAAVDATQFEVSYQYSNNGGETYAAAVAVQNAGLYKQVITPAGASNYTGTKTSEAFEIAKADLVVGVEDKTTFYTGTALAADQFTLQYSGWVNGETVDDLDVKPTVDATGKVNASATPYTVKASGGHDTNYNYVFVNGKLTINPAKLKVVAKDNLGAGVGTDAAAITSWTGKEYFSDEAGHLASSWIYVKKQKNEAGEYEDVTVNDDILDLLATTAYQAGDPLVDYKFITGLTLTRPAGTEADEYVVTPSGASPVSANYEIVGYETGKFTIGKSDVIITLDNQAKVYGGTDPEFTYTITDADGNPLPAEDEAAIKAKITVDRENKSEDAGTYTITLTVEEGATFTNYQIDEVLSTLTSKLIITKRPLTITANAQVLYVGEDLEDLDQEAVSYDGLKSGENIEVELSFSATVEAAKDADGLTTDGEPDSKKYDDGIVVAIKDGQNDKTKNYDITLTDGDLTVIQAATVLFLDDQNSGLAAAIEAANGEARKIQFSSRTLNAGQWNTLVLPFATTVAEVSAALNYAVVDMMATSTNPETISLKLAFGEIPANVPFLVQPAANFDLKDANFGSKTIVYNADPKFDDGAGHYFIGTYTGHNVTSADKSEYYYSSSKKSFVNSSKSTKIGIMRAYLKDANPASSGARIITIEEPDGSVTAIDAVETENGNGNGAIYNLQGVRVNKAGKGVFIQNGKKYIK